MATKKVTTVFICDSCGRHLLTEKKANECAVKDKFQEQLYLVSTNPDFVESKDDADEDVDIEDSEATTYPSDAKSMDKVESVTISERIHGWRTTVYVRKEVKNGTRKD